MRRHHRRAPATPLGLDETNRRTDDPAETMMRKMREHATRLYSSGPNVEQRVLPLLGDDPAPLEPA